ncbi:hypothetical protein LCGC14_3099210 [marine sediment metagenome]|uniref:Uncharacterized protein n=1 Tax=marine sediment metagenome TaxID=412755 RepID=A0A0F8YYB8_9ZZZZ
MSVEKDCPEVKLSNGMRISAIGGLLAIFVQLAVIVWGAATLTARVGDLEGDVAEIVTTTNSIQATVNQHSVELARVGVRLDNISEQLGD